MMLISCVLWFYQPLNPHPESKWSQYFQDNEMLVQIDKDCRYALYLSVADPGGGTNPAMAPHQSWQWSVAPLGGRKSNDSIVNLLKCKDFCVAMAYDDVRWRPPF